MSLACDAAETIFDGVHTSKSDHLFTYFYLSMTPVVVVRVQALFGKLKLRQGGCYLCKICGAT
jgi:hypothetical protein